MKKIAFLIFVLCINYYNIHAQESGKQKFFTDQHVLNIKIRTDMDLILKQAKDTSNEKPVPAIIFIQDSNSLITCNEATIHARGAYRKENCFPPPLMIDLNKKGFPGKLKMVWPCDSDSKLFEQYVLKEYLVYKMYELFSSKSFRTRLVKVETEDVKLKHSIPMHYAFLIENIDQLAKRNGCLETESRIKYRTEEMNRVEMTKLAIFQFMIGNTDWNVPLPRNLKFLKCGSAINPIAVPYDFDYSGMVNAKYALPPEEIPIISIRERYYLGFPRTIDELKSAMELFRTKKSLLYKLINEQEGLEVYHKKEMKQYLDEFFEYTRTDKDIEIQFIQRSKHF